MTDQVQRFKYPGPGAGGGRDTAEGRKSFPMCETENVISTVQVMEKGVHNKLHFHGEEDGYWMDLRGSVSAGPTPRQLSISMFWTSNPQATPPSPSQSIPQQLRLPTVTQVELFLPIQR